MNGFRKLLFCGGAYLLQFAASFILILMGKMDAPTWVNFNMWSGGAQGTLFIIGNSWEHMTAKNGGTNGTVRPG